MEYFPGKINEKIFYNLLIICILLKQLAVHALCFVAVQELRCCPLAITKIITTIVGI